MESVAVNGVGAQVVHVHPLQGGFVRGLKPNGRSDPGFKGLLPSTHANAPPVAGLQSGKVEFRPRCAQIISGRDAKRQELSRDLAADRVQARIFRTGIAAAIAPKTGQGLHGTGFEGRSG